MIIERVDNQKNDGKRLPGGEEEEEDLDLD